MGLTARFFGKFQVLLDEELIDSWDADHTKFLFQILVGHRGHFFHKDQLIEYLWPEVERDKGLQRLRTRMHGLRRTLGRYGSCVETHHEGYTFSASCDCELDVETFAKLLAQAQRRQKRGDTEDALVALESALALYRGDYLDEIRYEDWAIEQRRHYEQLYLDALASAATLYARQAKYLQAIECCKKVLRRDRWREEVLRQAMIYCYVMGHLRQALRFYEQHQEHVETPEPATQACYRQILEGRVQGVEHYPSYHDDLQHLPPALTLPLVGRGREFAQLMGHLNQALQGEGRLLLLGGEAGVGKTRLVQQLLQSVTHPTGGAAPALTALVGHCNPVWSSPCRTLWEAVRPHLTRMEPRKMDLLPLYWQVLSQRFFELETWVGPQKPPPALDPEAEQQRFFEAFSQLLLNLAQPGAPLLLFLDDVHWAETTTIAFLDYWLEQANDRPLLTVMTYRTEQVEPSSALERLIHKAVRGDDRGAVRHMSLSPLSQSDYATLFKRQLDAVEQPDDLIQALYKKTGGNALFLTTYLQLLNEQKTITVLPNGRWQVGPHALEHVRHETPDVIQQMIAYRVQRLDEETGDVLDILGAFGPRCAERALVKFWEQQRPALPHLNGAAWLAELDKHLDALLGANLIAETGLEFHFVHESVYEVAYGRIGSRKRRQLHRQWAQVLAANDRPSPRLLLHHYERAAMPQAALEQASGALERLLANHQLQEAHRVALVANRLQASLDPDDLDPQRWFDVLGLQAKLFARLGDKKAQQNVVVEMLALAQATKNDHQLVQAHGLSAQLALERSDFPNALKDAFKVLQVSQATANFKHRVRALNLIGVCHTDAGNYPEAMDYLNQALDVQQAHRENTAETFLNLGRVAWLCGKVAEAEGHYRQASVLEEGKESVQMSILFSMGDVSWAKNDFDKAFQCFQEVYALAQEVGDVTAEARALGDMGTVLLSTGHYERAEQRLLSAIDTYKRIQNRRGYGINTSNLGLVYWSLGQNAAARQHFERALDTFNAIGWDVGQGLVYDNLGLVYWREGDLDQALEHCQKALSLHRQATHQLSIAYDLRHLGEIALDQADFEAALSYLAEARVVSNVLGAQEEQMLVLSAYSLAHLKLNRHEKALECAQKALELLLVRGGDTPQAAQVWFNQFKVLQNVGQEREKVSTALDAAHRSLMQCADRIETEAYRLSFLDIPLHRDIVAAVLQDRASAQLTEAQCFQWLREVRWPEGVACPHCDSSNTRLHGKVSNTSERRYACKDCKKTFNDRSGTPLANSNIPIAKLFEALRQMHRGTLRHPRALARAIAVHPKTAEKLYPKLEEALQSDPTVQGLLQKIN